MKRASRIAPPSGATGLSGGEAEELPTQLSSAGLVPLLRVQPSGAHASTVKEDR